MVCLQLVNKPTCPQVTLAAVAPLTNLAVAVQLDPSFPSKLKALYIMGGNIDCRCPSLLSPFCHVPVSDGCLCSQGKHHVLRRV